jgi:hypothetical protein
MTYGELLRELKRIIIHRDPRKKRLDKEHEEEWAQGIRDQVEPALKDGAGVRRGYVLSEAVELTEPMLRALALDLWDKGALMELGTERLRTQLAHTHKEKRN